MAKQSAIRGCHALTVFGKACLGGVEYVCIPKTLLAEDGQAVAPGVVSTEELGEAVDEVEGFHSGG